MEDHDDARRSSRALGRWKLLRNALLDKRQSSETKNNQHSIHSFGGYGMLRSQWVMASDDDEDYANLLRNICDVDYSFDCSGPNVPRLTQVMDAVGLDSLDIPMLPNCQSIADNGMLQTLPSGWNAKLLSKHSITDAASPFVRIWRCDNGTTSLQQNREFGIKAYRCANDETSSALFVHERRLQRTTLQDLVRHRSTGIDNTGSVCVWDAAQTLAWAMPSLLEQDAFGTSLPTVILELGSGMAALSSLLLLKHLNRSGVTPKVFITDGQVDSVENNNINCLLLESELRSHVECALLPWSISTQAMKSIQASITLIADCTHFEEYHGELLWTMLYHTTIGGRIYLCQPMRGKSWTNFASLIEKVNERSSSPVLVVTQLKFTEIEQMRIECESESKKTGFRADVHHPFIVSVSKLRQETEADRQCILELIHLRNIE